MTWTQRFPAIAERVRRWGERIPPWDFSGANLVKVQRRCDLFVFYLQSGSHRWHLLLREDGSAYGSGAGWKIDVNNEDVEELELKEWKADRPADPISIEGEWMRIDFDRFDIAMYELFLKAKRLPEYRIETRQNPDGPDDLTYTIHAPARFANMLGLELPAREVTALPMNPALMDDQREIVQMALAAKRFASWKDCGLGKTLEGLEWSRQVMHITGGRVLIFTMPEVVQQWIDEAEKFYPAGSELELPIIALDSRAAMKEWCIGEGPHTDVKLAVTNYEKLNHKSEADQVVHELRHLAGIVPDESSRLKTGGGKQKWALIKSSKGVEYKLSLTATPAPNEIMEFASQASFLEKLRDQNEIIWTYFRRDEKTHRWTVKKHARKAFFEFMAGWSIYVRDPRKYGWRKNAPVVPDPEIFEYTLKPTDEQREFVQRFHADHVTGDMALIPTQFTNTIQRNKLGQVAKGFCYRKGEGGAFDLIPSPKPAHVAQLIRDEVARGLQVLVWTVFDAESQIIAEELEKPVPAKDFTAEHEARVAHDDVPASIRSRELIADYRRRQAAGDAWPSWDHWSEFTITLDGRTVHVVYEPRWTREDTGHFDFHGPITETGYRSHFQSGITCDDRPDIIDFAHQFAVKAQAEAIKDARKRHKIKKNAPDPVFPDAKPPTIDATVNYELLTGKTPKKKRPEILEAFRHGEIPVLISRPVMLGYGMNMQHCGSMIFSGFNDSYEQFYQALRRAYRFGQTRKLRVHIPYIPELEGEVWENILRKQEQHEAAIAEMEQNYIAARAGILPAAPQMQLGPDHGSEVAA